MDKELVSELWSFLLENSKLKWSELRKSLFAGKKIIIFFLLSSSTLIAGIVALLYALKRKYNQQKKVKSNLTPSENENRNFFDVCIVGASNSGVTCAFYLARAGKNVLLLEKKYFNLEEQKCYCFESTEDDEMDSNELEEKGIEYIGSTTEVGVGIPAKGQTHLKNMGVLQQILSEGKARWANNFGFISPCGNSFVGNGVQRATGRVVFVGRKDLKQKMVISAMKEGAQFLECCEMTSFEFKKRSLGAWEITYIDKRRQSSHTVNAQVLIAADGGKSEIARHMSLQKEPPNCVGFFAKVDPQSHSFKPDVVSYFPSSLLSNKGYVGLYKNFDESVTIGCFGYLDELPSSNEEEDLHSNSSYKQLRNIFNNLLVEDTNIKELLGPKAVTKIIKKVMVLRTNYILTQKLFSDNFIVLGHAAGLIDPLTGMGAQYGMIAAKLAAETVVEAFVLGDLSASQMKKFQDKCFANFGYEFLLSYYTRIVSSRFPIMVDSVASLVQDRGEEYLTKWGLIMTGVHSKLSCLHPRFFLLYCGQLIKEIWKQKLSPYFKQIKQK